jgi:hypothetical protein
MTKKERLAMLEIFAGMVGRKYVFDKTDRVTVYDITLDGNTAVVNTSRWTKSFIADASDNGWLKRFRRLAPYCSLKSQKMLFQDESGMELIKNAQIAKLERIIMEKDGLIALYRSELMLKCGLSAKKGSVTACKKCLSQECAVKRELYP